MTAPADTAHDGQSSDLTEEETMTAQPDEQQKPEETPEGDQPEAPETPTEPAPDEPDAPPEPEQPADVDDDDGGKVIELHSPTGKGSLTLRPGQVHLDEHQRAALVAIGIDTVTDPGVTPHVRPFMHMCQAKGLDPWMREAYLIGRGTGKNRKWTMQTGIDGYRKMAGATGRFIRVKSTVWTGDDDDDRSYVAVDDGEGGVVMKRRWYDQWPAARGNPGAAKVTIEHYDEFGNVTTTSAVADWGMYAPYSDEWEGPTGNRRKKIGPDGKPVRTLNEMWQRGGPHMLAKCLPGSARIQTDRGTLTIGEVVRGRLPVKVRSIHILTGEEVWRPVVNWWTNAPTHDWVRIWTPNGSRGNKPVRMTGDHPVQTSVGMVKAEELREGDEVAVTSPTLSAQQREVILGGLLGDAHLAGRRRPSTQPHLAISHSTAQRDYAHWTTRALANLRVSLTETEQGDGTGKRHPVVRLRTAAAAALYEFRDMTPQDKVRALGTLGLAVWIMDDGAFKATGGKSGSVALNIHCCGFGIEFAEFAAAWFRTGGYRSAHVLRPEKNPYLTFSVEDTEEIIRRIEPYLTVDGTRKVWVAEDIEQGHEHGMAYVPVLRVESVHNRKAETRYDIEVQQTHTFVTNGLVVSNCAEALADRKGFPATMSGVYTHEEMHRLDAVEQQRIAGLNREHRQAAYAAAQAATHPEQVDAGQQATDDGAAPSGPLPVGEVAEEVVGKAREAAQGAAGGDGTATTAPEGAERPAQSTDPAERAQMLRDELDFQSSVLGQSTAVLARRAVKALRKNVEQFTDAELLPVIAPLRTPVAARLRTDERPREAALYETVGADEVVSIEVLFAEPAPEAESTDEPDPRLDVDPAEPHEYVDAQGTCAVPGCDRFEDDVRHFIDA